MVFANNLKTAMAARGMSVKDLADAVPCSPQSVYYWLSGKKQPGKKLPDIAKALNTSVEALTEAANDALLQEEPASQKKPERLSPQEIRRRQMLDELVLIPEYGFTLSAGETGADEPTWEEVHNTTATPYSREYLLRRMVKPESCRIATVSGDSMEPTLESGDKVLFSEFKDFTVGSYPIIDGCIYVISIEGSMKIKRLCKIRGGILVMSDNERYSDESFVGDQCDQVQIYGRVIEMRRKL